MRIVVEVRYEMQDHGTTERRIEIEADEVTAFDTVQLVHGLLAATMQDFDSTMQDFDSTMQDFDSAMQDFDSAMQDFDSAMQDFDSADAPTGRKA